MAETMKWQLATTTNAQVEDFIDAMLAQASTMELAGKNQMVANETIITHLSFEQYFMRNSSYAAVSVVFVRTADSTEVSAISSGGSQGLLNIDWGSSSNFIDKVEKALNRMTK